MQYLRRALAEGKCNPPQAERYRGYIAQLEAEQTAPTDLFPDVLVLETTGEKRLAERRIGPATIAAFQIIPGTHGWTYPTPDGQGTRWKAYEKGGEGKYKWLPEKPKTAKYYYPPRFFEAVSQAGGVCWYVSGEADTWAMHAAGIEYVFSTYGETNIPDTLAQDLQAFGATALYIAPDLDPQGQRWAQEVANALAGSGVELDCRTLPSELGARGDIGKAWQTYTSKRPFLFWLLGLPRVYLTPDPSPEPTPKPRENYRAAPPGYRALIEHTLAVSKYNEAGYFPVRCPFHEDERKSGSLHQEMGLHCFVCNRWYTWQELGQKLGHGTIRAWLNTQATKCLSTQTREKLLQTKQVAAARVLDTLYLSGWEAGRAFTLSEAAQTLEPYGIKLFTLRTALSSNIFGKFPAIQVKRENLPEKNQKYSKRGKPALTYELPSPARVGEAVGVLPGNGQHYDPLDVEALTSNRTYRIAVHGAMLHRLPGKYSRKKLGKRLGVSGRTTQTYDETARVEALPQVEVTPLTGEDIAGLSDDRLKGVWLETDLAHTKTGEKIKYPLNRYGYEKAANAGAVNFYRVKQTMNLYQPKGVKND